MSTNIQPWTLERVLEPDESAICVTFSPDSSSVVSGGGSHNSILVWDTASFTPRRILDGTLQHRVWCAKFSNSGAWLACGEDDAGMGRSACSIYLFQMPDLRLAHILTSHQGKVSDMFFLGDDLLISGGRDGNVLVWDLDSGEVIGGCLGNDYITSIAIASDAQHIITGSLGGKINLWNTESMTLEYTWTVKAGLLEAQGAGWIRKVLFLDDDIVIAGHDQNRFTLWNIQTKENVGTVKNTGNTEDFALSPNGQILAQINMKGGVIQWDTSSWQKRELAEKHGVPFASNGRSAIDFSLDGRRMVSTGRKKEIFVWKIANV